MNGYLAKPIGPGALAQLLAALAGLSYEDLVERVLAGAALDG